MVAGLAASCAAHAIEQQLDLDGAMAAECQTAEQFDVNVLPFLPVIRLELAL